ncbi:MAG: calcium-binding protein, partial [Pseudomonadota bacterium]
MALSNLNLLSEGAYFSLLYDMLKQRENPFLLAGTGFDRIHNGGGDGNPTFGYGFNLAAFNANIVEAVIRHAYSNSLTSEQLDGLDLILDWKTGVSVQVNGQSVTLTNANIINLADVSLNGAPGAFGSTLQRAAVQSLSLNDAQATRMLDVMVKGDLNLVHIEGPVGSYGYEDGLDYRLAEEGVPAYSTERAALLSVYYNAPSLIGPGVQNSILNDDRPQLWYEIRYNHNQFNNNGLQNRRAEESDLIGLVSQAAKTDPAANILEFAHALDIIYNADDRLGRRILTRIEERDALDDLQAAIEPELQALLDYYVLQPLGANSAPTIDYVQADQNNISEQINAGSTASAGVPGGKGAADTVNLILGEGGNDLILGLGAADYLYGGDGDDTIYGDGAGTPAGTDGHDLIDGGPGNDILYGGDGDEFIVGGPGADILDGAAGRDVLVGSAGNDSLSGGSGNDSLDGGTGADFIVAGAGRDTVNGGSGDDRIDAGSQHDTVDAGGNHDSAFGGNGWDTLLGNNGNDTLSGARGKDLLDGGKGFDYLLGGDDGDRLTGGALDDTLVGGAGNDNLDGGDGDDRILGGSGRDTITGGSGDDLADAAAGADIISGGTGRDDMFGGTGADVMSGQGGNDTLSGGADNDTITGGNGFDVLLGGDGDDSLDGGNLNDILLGHGG